MDDLGNPVEVVNPADGQLVQVQSILDLDDPDTRIYEVHMAMTQEWATQLLGLGYPAGLPLGFDRHWNGGAAHDGVAGDRTTRAGRGRDTGSWERPALATGATAPTRGSRGVGGRIERSNAAGSSRIRFASCPTAVSLPFLIGPLAHGDSQLRCV